MTKYYSVTDQRYISKKEQEQIKKDNEKYMNSNNIADLFKCKFVMKIESEDC